MSASAKAKKRPRGRPATGRYPMVGLRLSPDMTGRIDKWAHANRTTRSEAMRRLIEVGLVKGQPRGK